MATIDQIKNRVATDLGLLRPGQALPAEHGVRILAGYNEVFASLKNEGLVTWAQEGEVPDEVVPYLVAMVCDNCLNTYPVSPERYQRIKSSFSTAKREIMAQSNTRYISAENPTDY